MGGSDHQHLDEGVTKEVAGQHAIGRNLAIDLDQMAAAVFQPAGDVSASCRIARRNGVDRTERRMVILDRKSNSHGPVPQFSREPTAIDRSAQ